MLKIRAPITAFNSDSVTKTTFGSVSLTMPVDELNESITGKIISMNVPPITIIEPNVPTREETVTERLLLVISITEVQSKFGRRISIARPTLATRNTMQSGRITFLNAVSIVMWPGIKKKI